jgi:hypothetical protein
VRSKFGSGLNYGNQNACKQYVCIPRNLLQTCTHLHGRKCCDLHQDTSQLVHCIISIFTPSTSDVAFFTSQSLQNWFIIQKCITLHVFIQHCLQGSLVPKGQHLHMHYMKGQSKQTLISVGDWRKCIEICILNRGKCDSCLQIFIWLSFT